MEAGGGKARERHHHEYSHTHHGHLDYHHHVRAADMWKRENIELYTVCSVMPTPPLERPPKGFLHKSHTHATTALRRRGADGRHVRRGPAILRLRLHGRPRQPVRQRQQHHFSCVGLQGPSIRSKCPPPPAPPSEPHVKTFCQTNADPFLDPPPPKKGAVCASDRHLEALRPPPQALHPDRLALHPGAPPRHRRQRRATNGRVVDRIVDARPVWRHDRGRARCGFVLGLVDALWGFRECKLSPLPSHLYPHASMWCD